MQLHSWHVQTHRDRRRLPPAASGAGVSRCEHVQPRAASPRAWLHELQPLPAAPPEQQPGGCVAGAAGGSRGSRRASFAWGPITMRGRGVWAIEQSRTVQEPPLAIRHHRCLCSMRTAAPARRPWRSCQRHGQPRSDRWPRLRCTRLQPHNETASCAGDAGCPSGDGPSCRSMPTSSSWCARLHTDTLAFVHHNQSRNSGSKG